MSFYANKKVLVTGGTGLIGRPLVALVALDSTEVNWRHREVSLSCPQMQNG